MNTARLYRHPLWVWLGMCSLMYVYGWYLYGQTVHFALVWDDKVYIEKLGAQRSADFLFQTLTSSFFVSNDYYRPLVQSSILAQWLWHENASVLHMTNAGIHILNSILVMAIASLVAARVGLARAKYAIAVSAALIYIAHPSLIESVAWISGRFDLVATFFVLTILFIERTWRTESAAKFVFVGVLFFLAALSKEMAVALPLFMPLWLLFWRENENDDGVRNMSLVVRSMTDSYALKIYGALTCGGLAYLSIRWVALGYLYTGTGAVSGVLAEPTLLQQFLLVMKSYGWYGLLSVWPAPYVSTLHPEVLPLAISDQWAWFSSLVLAVLLIGIYRMWLQGRSEVLFLGIMIVSLLPAANLLRLPVADNIVHDRFLTLPLAFFCILVATGFARLYYFLDSSRKILVAAIIMGWYAFLPLNTRLILPMWASDITLWTWASSQYPDNYRAASNNVAALLGVGNFEGCDKLTTDVLELQKASVAYMNRGDCLDHLGRLAEAESAYMNALGFDMLKSHYAMILVSIAQVQVKQQKSEDVLKLLEEAEKLLPGYLKTYLIGAHFLDSTQQFAAADEYYRRLLSVLSDKEKLLWNDYLKRRKVCIESTGRACSESAPAQKNVRESGRA